MLMQPAEPVQLQDRGADTHPPRSARAAWRLRAYPTAFISGILIGFLSFALSTSTTHGKWGRLGGDYPAFYAAGAMVADGNASQLYSLTTQQIEQAKLFPGARADFLPYVYPPFVALAYAPLSLLPYRASYICHTLLMLGILLLTIVVAGKSLPALRRYPAAALAAAILFHPMLRALIGGQNTAITLLLIVLAWQARVRGRDFLTGAFLGLLLYKPQFGVILIFWFLCERRWRVSAGVIACVALLYLAGAVVSGTAWPSVWAHAVSGYRAHDEALNFDTNISFTGIAGRITGSNNGSAHAIDLLASLALFIAVAWVFWRGTAQDFDLRAGLAAAAMLLVSPHTLYYDAGVMLLTLAVLSNQFPLKSWPFLLLVWAASWLQVVGGRIGFSPTLPLVIIVILVVALALRSLSRRREGALAL
jgi:hypothetical protein